MIMEQTFEDIIRQDLHQFLLSMKEVDERLPECPDVEEKWEEIAKAYIPDGIREFQDFPSASLGWMMYIGMAVAKMWDTEWEIYSKIDDLYAYMLKTPRESWPCFIQLRESHFAKMAQRTKHVL